MGAFGMIIRILHCMGVYIQLIVAFKTVEHDEVDNDISGNALFTEVPRDITTQSGQDVEMACSFRGAGSPSYSLEIQWWYIKSRRNREDKPAWTTNQVVPLEEVTKDATKISVVKVAGSNISHKLRLSSVKPSDEGTYECRVTDFSSAVAQQHRVRAYLQVEVEEEEARKKARGPAGGHEEPGGDGSRPRKPAHRGQPQGGLVHPSHPHRQTTEGRELKRRSAISSTTDCTESCVL